TPQSTPWARSHSRHCALPIWPGRGRRGRFGGGIAAGVLRGLPPLRGGQARLLRMPPVEAGRREGRGREGSRRRAVVNGRCARRRSEEHTSELQSREKLVCRLL